SHSAPPAASTRAWPPITWRCRTCRSWAARGWRRATRSWPATGGASAGWRSALRQSARPKPPDRITSGGLPRHHRTPPRPGVIAERHAVVPVRRRWEVAGVIARPRRRPADRRSGWRDVRHHVLLFFFLLGLPQRTVPVRRLFVV